MTHRGPFQTLPFCDSVKHFRVNKELFPQLFLAANITLMKKVFRQLTVRAIEKEGNVHTGVFRPFALGWHMVTSSQRKLILPLPSA